MDPLSALGVAASVMQFVQFGSSLVSKSRQLYTQGALLDHVECGRATTRLQELAGKLATHVNELESLGILSSDSKALQAICARCLELSTDLLSRLSEIKVDEKQKARGWKSFRQALKSVCSKDKIDGIAGKLLACREELNSHLITCIKYKADALALAQEDTVAALNRHSEDAKNSIQTLIESRDMLQKSLQEHREAFYRPSSGQQPDVHPSLLSSLSETQWVEIRLVQSLRFSSMDDRHFEIPEAHRRTFKWIFSPSQEIGPGWSNFVEWLERGKGLYWINGKAGSGKSTLMRYIFDTQRTRRHLEAWAKENRLEISEFFFWNTGSPDQRSQVGLFRSLLFQALHKRPDLVRHIFPRQWAEQSSDLSHNRPLGLVWSLSVLKAAFKHWIDFAPAASRFCFFIDGLDEYEGDKEEMAEYFKDISSSSMSHVKICVSSRPLVEFDEAFEGLPSLRLQDLTFPDITAYVKEELASHCRMQLLPEVERAPLVSEIVNKATGVFLWVTLVVRSLLNGLRNRDGIDDLRRRLQELPSGLSDLYSHMFNNVEPLYRKQASQTFQIYDVIARETNVPCLLLQLAISATPQCIRSTSWSPMREEEIIQRCERLDVHLKTRCGGLLEIHRRTAFGPLSKVNYLHRTVREFLFERKVRGYITSTGGPDFNPYYSVVISFIFIMKKSLEFYINEGYLDSYGGLRIGSNIWTCIRPVFRYAKLAEESRDRSYIPSLEELEQVVIQRWKQEYSDSGKDWREAEVFDIFRIFREALSYGLVQYVEKKLDEKPSLMAGWQDIPLLFHALDPSKSWSWPPLEIIDLLLQRGADPNQIWNGESPWQQCLRRIHGSPVKDDDSLGSLYISVDIIKLFLKYGGSPVEICRCRFHHTGDQTIRGVIMDLFEADYPLEARELKCLLEEKIRGAQILEPLGASRY